MATCYLYYFQTHLFRVFRSLVILQVWKVSCPVCYSLAGQTLLLWHPLVKLWLAKQESIYTMVPYTLGSLSLAGTGWVLDTSRCSLVQVYKSNLLSPHIIRCYLSLSVFHCSVQAYRLVTGVSLSIALLFVTAMASVIVCLCVLYTRALKGKPIKDLVQCNMFSVYLHIRT